MTGSCAQIVLHSFLQKCSEEERKTLFSYLPEEEARSLETLQLSEKDLSLGFDPSESDFSHIHFSWFEPHFRKLSEAEIRLFLSSLFPHQFHGLSQRLLFSEALPPLSTFGQNFLRYTLFSSLVTEEILPSDCLPKHPLNHLLSLNYETLMALVGLLSMHDLSIEIRHIIDTMKLKKIYALLSKAEITYLKTLAHKKEPISFKPLRLSEWSGNGDLLKNLLEQRGLNRLAKALHLCHPSLLFYMSHRFSMEQGLKLNQLCTPLDHPQAASFLTKQILEILEAQDHPHA